MMKTNDFSRWKRRLLAVILCAGLIPLSACWSATEVNDLALVNVMAIDRDKAGKVEITGLIIKPGAIFSNSPNSAKGGTPEGGFLIETTTGKSLYEAIGRLSDAVSERLYFGHLNVLVFGERAARQRMISYLDFFKRQNDFRPNIEILVTKGSAKNLIQTIPQLNTTLGLELRDLTHSKRFGVTNMVKDISQFTEAAMGKTDPYTGVIKPAKKQGIIIKQERQGGKKTKKSGQKRKQHSKKALAQGGKIPKALLIKGTAVFKEDRLKGFLKEKETRGLLAIKGELENGIVVLNCGGNNKGTVTLNIKKTTSQMNPKVSDGISGMDVNIDVTAGIGDITCSGFNVSPASIDRLNKKLANFIKQDAKAALNKAKNHWQADIFGFGKAINRNHSELWGKISSGWENGGLRQLDVQLNVSANIIRHGLFKDPGKPNESR